MRKITIDLFDMEVCLYAGKKEILDYVKLSKKLKYKTKVSELGLGAVSGFLIWIRNLKDTPIIVHEVSHLVDNIIEYYNVGGGEIRAFLSEYLYRKITFNDKR